MLYSILRKPISNFENNLYQRWELRTDTFRGHLLKYASKVVSFKAGFDPQVLVIDFDKQSVRCDVAGKSYVPRPGCYMSELLAGWQRQQAVILNGNNIGYWGNQFLIMNNQLIYKTKPSIFYDPAEEIGNKAYFFFIMRRDKSFSFQSIYLERAAASDNTPRYVPHLEEENPIIYGISGYPLLMNNQIVWQEFVREAFDPKLLYDIGDLSGIRRVEMIRRLEQMHQQRSPLNRHGLTFLGIDQQEDIVTLSVEENADSCGIDLAESAHLLQGLGVENCIVLGGKGDVQLASTQEGYMMKPLISPHDTKCKREAFLNQQPLGFYERPLPGYITFHN